jgi:hypothetical protein
MAEAEPETSWVLVPPPGFLVLFFNSAPVESIDAVDTQT